MVLQVSDVVQGWKFAIEPKTSTEWAALATTWTHILCGPSTMPSLERQLQLRAAFLYAVKAGMGDFNMFHDAALVRRVCHRHRPT